MDPTAKIAKINAGRNRNGEIRNNRNQTGLFLIVLFTQNPQILTVKYSQITLNNIRSNMYLSFLYSKMISNILMLALCGFIKVS